MSQPTKGYAQSLVVGDVNGDGILDLVFADPFLNNYFNFNGGAYVDPQVGVLLAEPMVGSMASTVSSDRSPSTRSDSPHTLDAGHHCSVDDYRRFLGNGRNQVALGTNYSSGATLFQVTDAGTPDSPPS